MIHEARRRLDLFTAKTRSARRKNAAPAYRPANGRGDPQPHGVSQACAAFYVRGAACSEGFRCEQVESRAQFINNADYEWAKRG